MMLALYHRRCQDQTLPTVWGWGVGDVANVNDLLDAIENYIGNQLAYATLNVAA